jgi:hypothetical protein
MMRTRLSILAILMLSAAVGAAVVCASQSVQACGVPRSGGLLLPGFAEGVVQRKYWDLEKFTEVFVKLGPTSKNGMFLVFSICFPGRELPRTAALPPVQLRAQTSVVQPPKVGQAPTMVIAIDDQDPLDLLRVGPWWENRPCAECNLDAVLVDLPSNVFHGMLAARAITGESMGFTFALNESHILALRRFFEAIQSSRARD